MSEASPDSAATLSLVLWPRSDTSFTGYLHVGPPVDQTGWAYVWYESDALQALTISDNQDTTLWTTRTMDASLGGRFTVRGGPGAGSGGTWRAELRRGRPATVATLRARSDNSLLEDILPVLFMLGVVVAAALWIRREPQPPLGLRPPYPAFSTVPVGVSGFLLLFMFGQIAGVLMMLGRFGALFQSYESSHLWHIGGTAGLFRPLIRFEQALHALQIVAPLAGITLIVKRSRYAPRFWVAYLGWSLVCVAIDIAGAQLVILGLSREVSPEVGEAFRSGASKAASTTLGLSLIVVIWICYWSRSVRVRSTFGSGGFDRGIAATVPPATEPLPAEMTEAG